MLSFDEVSLTKSMNKMFLVQGRVPGLWLWPGAKQVLVRLSQSLHLMSRCQWPVTTPWARIRAVSGGWVMCHGCCFRRIFLHASYIYCYLFTLDAWICLSLYATSVIRIASHYLINIGELLVKLHQRVLTQSIQWQLRRWEASVYDEISPPLTCCQWLQWVTWQCQWLWRTHLEAEQPLGGHTRSLSSISSAASIGRSLMKCWLVLEEISPMRHEPDPCRTSWFSWKTKNRSRALPWH